MKKFFIKTLGCKVNQYDSLRLKTLLLKKGLKYSQNKPDYLIINTCAVTRQAIKKDWQVLKTLKRKHPQAKTIIFGCWPQIYNSEKFKEVDYVFKVGDIEKIVKEISNDNNASDKEGIFSSEKSRYFLKIADGCNQFCSYCIIPHSRGLPKSRNPEEIINEAKTAKEKGYQEIVLTAIHLGVYGKDFKDKNINLNKLLKKLLKEVSGVRFRLSSIEISEINTSLINLIAKSKGRICRHLHIPLQSGSDKILKLMNRPYNVSYFKKKLESIRLKLPAIAITTDIIVGFPQESEEDFKASFELSQELFFSKIHVFPFSSHQLVSASKLKPMVNEKTKKQRSAALRQLSDEMIGFYKAKILSAKRQLNLLVEKKQKNIIEAKSEFYFNLKFKFKDNKKVPVKLGQLIKVNKKDISIIN